MKIIYERGEKKKNKKQKNTKHVPSHSEILLYSPPSRLASPNNNNRNAKTASKPNPNPENKP